MTTRYRIEHVSRYEYDHTVVASFNEARLTPLQTPWQIRLDSTLSIDPVSWSYRYVDYWGTDVKVFEASAAHRAMEIRATSLVELDVTRRPALDLTLGWDEVRDATVADEYVEYLAQTEFTEPPTELADLAASLAADNGPHDAARSISAAVHGALTYTAGVTEVHTTATEAWHERRGVCQDYAHLALGALRHVGIPARYVSGYLHPSDDPLIGDTAVGESHAWVEYWLGDWTPLDPTNLSEVTERHIMVGTGRDYGDVPPIKGVVAGAGSTVGLSVTVELSRLA